MKLSLQLTYFGLIIAKTNSFVHLAVLSLDISPSGTLHTFYFGESGKIIHHEIEGIFYTNFWEFRFNTIGLFKITTKGVSKTPGYGIIKK